MNKDKIKKMCCPFDQSDLALHIFREDGNDVLEGLFTCSSCKRYFPIITGIPIMVPDEFRERDYEAPFLEKWKDLLPKQLPEFRTWQLKSEEL